MNVSVLHVIPSVSLSHGGPSRTSVNLVNSLSSRKSIKIYFYTYQYEGESTLNFESNISVIRVKAANNWFSKLCISDFFRLRKIIKNSSINLVHIHGAWHPLLHWGGLAARLSDVPYLVQPRGMLEPWTLGFRKWKKVLALKLYQFRDLSCSSGLIATSAQEAENLRSLGITGRINVIANGVERPCDFVRAPNVSIHTALFMSRIHPKKGVLELIRAWHKIDHRNWMLRIVGPDDGGHLSEVRSLIEKLNLGESVRLVGAKYGKQRISEFCKADLFVLPTFSENFGVVIAEALSYGLPVLTTKGAPWSMLIDYRCGWWIDTGENALVDTLPLALSLSPLERTEMGVRACKLASQFNWDSVSELTAKLYAEILADSFCLEIGR